MTEKKDQKTPIPEKDKKKGIWVPQFNKYIDDLTEEEWAIMTNSSCGDINSSCVENDAPPEKKK